MAFKFNRGCWVPSWEDSLTDDGAPAAPGSGLQKTTALHPALDPAAARPRRTRPAIGEKIRLARRLATPVRNQLASDTSLAALVAKLDRDLEDSRTVMIELGIGLACARCDATAPEGSCCSRGLEEKLDAILLVINLLLGVPLPDSRERADSCFFLGADGCRLRARHLLCVDYYCPELQEQLGPDALARMQAVAGIELETSFRLHEALRRALIR